MKTRLLFLLALTGLCCQPLQAASYYAKKALTGAATLGYWGALCYDSVQKYETVYQDKKRIEDMYSCPQAPPECIRKAQELAIEGGLDPKEVIQATHDHWYKNYHQVDPDLKRMVHQQAIKKGIDPKKIVCLHNDTLGVGPSAGTMRSLLTQNEHHFYLGPRHKAKVNSLAYFDEKWKTPLIQHELNHIKYRHVPLRLGAEFAIPFATHLILSGAFRLPFKLLGAAHGFRPTLLPHVTEKILLLPTMLAAKNYLTDNTWAQTIKPWLSRYQERQADLNIDDDPEIIKGLIDWLQYWYESTIKEIGKERVDELHKNGTHPHPLERIAYLTEKLHEAEKQKEEA